MEIRVETNAFNQRRYGQPWIATVNFEKNVKGEFYWGNWIGDYRNGGSGTLVIEALPGEIVATGQKDHRKPQNSAPDFFVVTSDGALESIGDKGDAYKYYLDAKKNVPDVEALKKEKDTLLYRVAQIDTILENIK